MFNELVFETRQKKKTWPLPADVMTSENSPLFSRIKDTPKSKSPPLVTYTATRVSGGNSDRECDQLSARITNKNPPGAAEIPGKFVSDRSEDGSPDARLLYLLTAVIKTAGGLSSVNKD